jgi:hypothetical protein
MKKYRRFELAVKEDNKAVQQAEKVLVQAPGKTIGMLSFIYYLFFREQQARILRRFYAEERTLMPQAIFCTESFTRRHI